MKLTSQRLFGLITFIIVLAGGLTPAAVALAASTTSTAATTTTAGATPAPATSGRPLDLITSPLPIDLNTKPGTSISTDLRIKQDDGVAETLQVSLLKFGAYGNQGKPELIDPAPGDDYFSWVHFSTTHFVAQSNVWQTVHMTINVPTTAANGYYYAVVFTRAGDATRQAGNTNALAGGTAILVLLNAEVPNQKRSMELVSFTADHRFYEYLPANFSINFHNDGNIHLVPQGDVFITKGNSQVATLDFNAEQGNILPNSYRIFTADWEDGWPHYDAATKDGKDVLNKSGNIVDKLYYSNGAPSKSVITPHFRFGRYTAHLLAVYDNGSRDVPLEASVTFWVIPWRFLIVVVIVALLVGFGIWALFRGFLGGVKRLGKGNNKRSRRRR